MNSECKWMIVLCLYREIGVCIFSSTRCFFCIRKEDFCFAGVNMGLNNPHE
jgi:hypothetical protein